MSEDEAVSESYPTESDGSTPTPPELPKQPADRWQFGLATLLLFTLACALAARAARLWRVSAWVQMLSLVVATVFLVYVFWRLRTVVLRWGRWNEIQRHRQELTAWAQRARSDRRLADGQQPVEKKGQDL